MLALLLFHLLTLRTGHRWGDDFALYVQHAMNLASGRPYAQTGYVPDPEYPLYSPGAYPPVFPLLLVPICRVFGMNFQVMKALEVLFFVASAGLFYALVRHRLPAIQAALLTALFGWNPYVWNFKENVLSDVPFLCFTLLFFLLADQGAPALLCGLALYLAAGTRTIGLILLPCLFVCDLIRFRRVTRPTVIAAAFCCGLLAIQGAVIRSNAVADYWRIYHPSLHTIGHNLSVYPGMLGAFFATPSAPLSVALELIAVGFAAAGVSRCRPFLLIAFGFFYAVALAVWPVAEPRFLIPLYPLLLYCALLGAQRLAGGAAATTLGLSLLASFAIEYGGQDFGPIRESYGDPEFVKACAYIRTHTLPDDRIVFNRARALALFTGHFVSPYHDVPDPAELWTYFEKNDIGYIVWSDVFRKDREVLGPALKAHSAAGNLLYQNSEFTIYRIRPAARAR